MIRTVGSLVLTVSLALASASAQTPAHDPSDRLREVLPEHIVDRVLAKIAEARSRGLPAEALEQRALKFAARGVKPEDIERSVAEQSQRMEHASEALAKARGRNASGDEVDAGAEAMRMGVDGEAISTLAKSAPSGRSMAVPLLVMASLVDRGLPSDEALARVRARLEERATDAELERMPGEVGKPALTGRELAETKRPEGVGRPATVPPNAGQGARPTTGEMPGRTKRPVTPPRP